LIQQAGFPAFSLMKNFFILFLTLLPISLLFSLEWTILVYMAADNGLCGNAIEDINEMESIYLPDDVNVIVQADFSQYDDIKTAFRYKIRHDNNPANIYSQVIQEMGEIDSGDWQTLADFVNWGKRRFPADHYALIIWSHGNSWYKEVIPDRSICPDVDSDNYMSVAEGHLKSAFADMEINFDLVIFDACNMFTIETITEIKDYCNYVIGSEESVPADGLPYDEVFTFWQSHESTKDLAGFIAERYVRSYQPGGSQNISGNDFPVSCGSAETAGMEKLLELITEFSRDWKFSATESYFTTARDSAAEFNDPLMDVDIRSFFRKLSQQNIPVTLSKDLDSLNQQIDNVFYTSFFNDYEDEFVGAATIWFPQYQNTFTNLFYNWGYHKLDFSATEWTAFLNLSFGEDKIAPEIPQNILNVVELSTQYLSWDAPVDPSPLKYNIYSENETQIDNIEENEYRITSEDAAGVFISCQDDSGNESSKVFLEFQHTTNKNIFYVAPNPGNDPATLRFIWYFEETQRNVNLKVYDIAANLILDTEFDTCSQGEHQYAPKSTTFSQLSTGIFFSVLKTDNLAMRTKFAITK